MTEVRCPDCGKMLLKAEADGMLYPYCRKCGKTKEIAITRATELHSSASATERRAGTGALDGLQKYSP